MLIDLADLGYCPARRVADAEHFARRFDELSAGKGNVCQKVPYIVICLAAQLPTGLSCGPVRWRYLKKSA